MNAGIISEIEMVIGKTEECMHFADIHISWFNKSACDKVSNTFYIDNITFLNDAYE